MREVEVFSNGSGGCPSSLVAAPFLLLLWVMIFFTILIMFYMSVELLNEVFYGNVFV